jgi:hypothetical protein
MSTTPAAATGSRRRLRAARRGDPASAAPRSAVGHRRASRSAPGLNRPRPPDRYVGVVSGWDARERGVVLFPSGRRVYGRSLRRPLPEGASPDLGIYLLARPPAPLPWDARWLRWPDFGLPTERLAARDVLFEAWSRALVERVEIACGGGRGRTGTALACLAVLDGVPAREAVTYVRQRFSAWAVETPWQRRYVAEFPTP